MIVRLIAWMRARMLLVKLVSIGVLAVLIVTDLFIPRHHPHFLGDVIPGFWAGFGFTACVLIIIVSKWLGTVFLFRPDTYYAVQDPDGTVAKTNGKTKGGIQ